LRAGGWSSISAIAGPVAVDARHDGQRVIAAADFQDETVAGIGSIDVARRIHGEAPGREFRRRRGAARAGEYAALVVARDGTDDPVGSRHLANDIICRVCDVQVAVRIERDALRRAQPGAYRRTSVAAVGALAGTSHSRHSSIRNFAHAIIRCVGDVQVARRI
jgi:hypothetical protein